MLFKKNNISNKTDNKGEYDGNVCVNIFLC